MSENIEHLAQVAKRCRELREVSDVDLETLASDLSMDKKTIISYESGQVDIPISYLTKLSQRFSVEIVDLVSGGSSKLKTYAVCRKDKGIRVEHAQEYEFEALVTNFSHKKCEPFVVTVDPDEDKPWYMNSHDGHEFDYILEGQMKMLIEDQEVTLNTGDSIYLDSQFMHGLKAIGAPARFLAIVLP